MAIRDIVLSTATQTALNAAVVTAKTMTPTAASPVRIVGLGTITLTTAFNLDTAFLKFISATGNPADFVLASSPSLSGPLVYRTCSASHLSGMSLVQNNTAPGYRGITSTCGSFTYLLAPGVSDAASHMFNVIINHSINGNAPSTLGGGNGVSGGGDYLDKVMKAYSYVAMSNDPTNFKYCYFAGGALRPSNGVQITGNGTNCTFLDWSVGSDANSASVTGLWNHITAGDYCFGSCFAFGCPVPGIIENSSLGNMNVSIGFDHTGIVRYTTLGSGGISGGTTGPSGDPTSYRGTCSHITITSSFTSSDDPLQQKYIFGCSGGGMCGSLDHVTINGQLIVANSTFTGASATSLLLNFSSGSDISPIYTGSNVFYTGIQVINNSTNPTFDTASDPEIVSINGTANRAIASTITNSGTLTLIPSQLTPLAGIGDDGSTSDGTIRGMIPFVLGAVTVTASIVGSDIVTTATYSQADHFVLVLDGVWLGVTATPHTLAGAAGTLHTYQWMGCDVDGNIIAQGSISTTGYVVGIGAAQQSASLLLLL